MQMVVNFWSRDDALTIDLRAHLAGTIALLWGTNAPGSRLSILTKKMFPPANAPKSGHNMEPESNTDSNDIKSTVYTYHCICHTLILATHHALSSLPTRASSKDGAMILASASQAQVVHTIEDGRAMIIRREDGFEKRTLVRCERCLLVVGYKLDGDHFEESSKEAGVQTLYVLPGALVDTAGMMTEKTPEVPVWAREVD